MDTQERIYSVIVVSSSEKFKSNMQSLLDNNRFYPIDFSATVSYARRRILERKYDLMIINSPLKDEFGTALALDVCESTGLGVLLLVKAEHYYDVSAKVSPCGVLTLSKPTNPFLLAQSLDLLCSTRERLYRMEQKAASFEEKIEDIRIVNRAKCILIEQLKMTEQEAHRFIEKQAMDRCTTKRAFAEKIISTYQ